MPQASCFPENFAKFLRTPFFTENLQWLLLIFDDFLVKQLKDFSRLFDYLFMHERVNKDITESYVHSVHILCTGGKVPLLLKA